MTSRPPKRESPPFDAKLADRLRAQAGRRAGVSEKFMFGCPAFFVNGNLGCAVRGKELLVRVGPEASGSASKEPGARPARLSGRLMKGWVLVDPAKTGDAKSLSKWIGRGLDYAASLTRKSR